MRLCLFLLPVLVAVGCNADPRCRRETALLRAEILDLEDKLALATAGSPYTDGVISSGGIVSSHGEVIVSEPIVELGSPQIIYESEVPYSSSSTVQSPIELEVQHQIFPDTPTGSATKPTPALQPDDLNIEIDSPQLPTDLDSILPNGNQDDLIDVPEVKLPTNEGSKTQRRRSPRRRSTQLETEIALNDSPLEMDIDIEDTQDEFITEIVVNRHASVGQNVDGHRGDEGLNLLVQPRTADGSVHVVAGELSVDLIDPKASFDTQTIGHWQFLPAETELFFASDRREGEGILLHLPWEQNLPTHQNLVVAVSFTTPDGRVLSTSSRLRVNPPSADYSPDDPQVTGWAERDTRWEIGTHNQSVKNGTDQWIKSRKRGADYAEQFAKDRLYDADDGGSRRGSDSLPRPRVKAIPASSTRPATQLPSWRPVR